MTLLSYQELAGIRLQDFVPNGLDIELQESGMNIVVGFGGYERVGNNYFEWRQGELFQTAAVTIDLDDSSALPQSVILRILEKLGLKVLGGMTMAELAAIYGDPCQVQNWGGGESQARFICGGSDKYILGCHLSEATGLRWFFFARKDYIDEDEMI